MTMTMKGSIELPADRAAVWMALNDPAVLRTCIPGCQSLENTNDNRFAAIVKLKIGPVTATFKGNVTLSEINILNGYRITGEGDGGVAGCAKGGASVTMTDLPGGGTLLSYDVQAQVAGKIAQLGSRLIDGVAKKTADTFFGNFAAGLKGESVQEDVPAGCEVSSPARVLRPQT